MRKVVFQMMISLDGFFEGPEKEIDWHNLDAEFNDHVIELHKHVDTEVELFQLREVGVWRFIQTDNEGQRYGFHEVFHEVAPEKRLVYTFEYEGMPDHPALIIDTLENIEGMTKFTELTVFPSVEERDGMVQTDMKMGIEESMERIDELLKECCGEMMWLHLKENDPVGCESRFISFLKNLAY